MTEQQNHNLSRRRFLKGALTVGGILATSGVGYRMLHNYRGRNFDPGRSETLLAGIPPTSNPATLPNIVLIMVDDLGYGDLSGYGSQAIETPNLDQMADGGVRLTNFCATAPLCSPSRAGLLSGRYPIRTHITMPLYPRGAAMDIFSHVTGMYNYDVRGIPEDEVLLPELLQRQGYRTALIGKWHLGDRSPHRPNENGFNLFYGAY